jgi:phosphocarrier protein HPr
MIKRKVTITNELGLHARAAAKLVHLTAQFSSDITVQKDGQQANGKSIMGILLLAAPRGSKLTIVFEGEDEDNAAEAVCALIKDKFGEK